MDIADTRNGEDKFKIEWNAKYEIGIPAIDEQHKKLVELEASFYTKLLTPTTNKDIWKTELTKALKDCCAYVQTHFRAEEELLKAAGYTQFSAHKAQHDEFTTKVLETARSFDSSNTLTAVKFARFLYDWILSHIQYTDRLYIPCVKTYLANKKTTA